MTHITLSPVPHLQLQGNKQIAAFCILTPPAEPGDTQTRQIQQNISHVEKHFGELCQLFAGYVRKTARLRDKADLLVREIGLYADTETPNLKNGLKHFADQLAKIQDYRQAQVERLDAKVVEPMKAYGSFVKLKRAETELQRATMDATRTTQLLEETIDLFERQKIRDIKKIFGEFVTVEMAFHAKALEMYTTAYQHISNVDEEADLEVFRSSLHPLDCLSHMGSIYANSKASLNHTGMSTSKSGTLQSQTKGQKKKVEEEEEDDDEEDDDDEDDDDEDEDLEEVTDDEK
ncbi:Protein FAM92A [Bagarius yarrelli]|uniref:Protein FAM92A n=1 Tax=Bagarius yarrelli TaxID=175774 RepID=A0A556TNT3_BAGYA|nr:Protein FAM92A [Bagarius yarrelli]